MQARLLRSRIFNTSADTAVCPSYGKSYFSKNTHYAVNEERIKRTTRYEELIQWHRFTNRSRSTIGSVSAKMDNFSTPLVVAFGIPTTDYSFLVSDKSIVEKYELNVDSQREISHDLLDTLKGECHEKNFQFKKIAGGNCQVSLMVFQNLIKEHYQTVMCGAVGDDDNGLFVDKYITNKFIRTEFDVIRNGKTASCVIAVHKDLRTIAVTNGVGSEYSLSQCTNLKRKIELATSSTVVLFEGFFVGFSYDIAMPIMQKCKMSGSVVALNISGSYILENFPHQFMACWRKSDVLVGNLSEFNSLCDVLCISGNSLRDRLKIVQKMMLSEKKTSLKVSCKLRIMKSWRKILVVTNNKEPVYCVFGNGEVIEFQVPRIAEEDIVDTSGAGDSFLGGFLYGLIEQEPLEKCLEIACVISSRIIKTHGYDL